MYNYIFWVKYRADLSSGDSKSRFDASLIVAVALTFHVGLIIAIIQRFF